MGERGPKGDGEFVWEAEIVEIKSEVLCRECGQGLVAGNTFTEDERTQAKYHNGCGNAVKQRNPIAGVYMRVKSWPAQKANYPRPCNGHD